MQSPNETKPNGISEVPLVAGIRIVADWAGTRFGGVVLLTVLAALLAVPVLSYNGFCFSKKRFLSNEEFFSIAIPQVAGHLTAKITEVNDAGNIVLKSVRVILYQSGEEFQADKPSLLQDRRS